MPLSHGWIIQVLDIYWYLHSNLGKILVSERCFVHCLVPFLHFSAVDAIQAHSNFKLINQQFSHQFSRRFFEVLNFCTPSNMVLCWNGLPFVTPILYCNGSVLHFVLEITCCGAVALFQTQTRLTKESLLLCSKIGSHEASSFGVVGGGGGWWVVTVVKTFRQRLIGTDYIYLNQAIRKRAVNIDYICHQALQESQ